MDAAAHLEPVLEADAEGGDAEADQQHVFPRVPERRLQRNATTVAPLGLILAVRAGVFSFRSVSGISGGAWITFSCFGDWESSVLLSEMLLRGAKRLLCLTDLSRPFGGGSSTILA